MSFNILHIHIFIVFLMITCGWQKQMLNLKMFYGFNSNTMYASWELKGLVESLLFNPEKSTHVNWFELTIRLALDFLFLGVRCLFLPLYNESKLFLKQIKIIINIFSCLGNINLSSFSVTSPCKKKIQNICNSKPSITYRYIQGTSRISFQN